MRRIQRSVILFLSLWVMAIGALAGLYDILFPVPSAGQPPVNTPTPVPILVATIHFTDTHRLGELTGQFDIWEIDHSARRLVASLTPVEVDRLRRAGYSVTVDSLKTDLLQRPLQALPGQVSGIPGYPCYRTVEETHADLAQLATNYSDLATWVDIGDSWQKREGGGGYDIRALVLTNRATPDPKPKFLLLAAVHARELATAELATRFAEHLVTNYTLDPDITWLLDYTELHLISQANPDGRKLAEAGSLWRKNIDSDDGCTISSSWGVDLNRNSSFKWNQCATSGCSSSNACQPVYRGPGPTSEPETQALEAYVSSIFPDQRGPLDTDPAPDDATGLFISLHSYGEWILFPWGWQPGPAPNNTQLETLGRKFGFFTGYETCQSGEPNCIYPTDGTNDDWAYGKLGLASYTFELGTDFFQACPAFENTVIPDNFPALLYAFKAARQPYRSSAGPDTLQIVLTPTIAMAGEPVTLTVTADDTRYDSHGWGTESAQNIAAIRYSLAAPSWVTGTSTFPFSPIDGRFDAPVESAQAIVDTTNRQPGRYQLFIESQDAAGNWGVPSSAFLWIKPGLFILPSSDTRQAKPGQQVIYDLQISSTEAVSDVLTISMGGNQWPTSAPASVTMTAAGTTFLPLVVTVDIPSTARAGDEDKVTLQFLSQELGQIIGEVTLTTRVPAELYFPMIFKGG